LGSKKGRNRQSGDASRKILSIDEFNNATTANALEGNCSITSGNEKYN
jgi:hypothetical protein